MQFYANKYVRFLQFNPKSFQQVIFINFELLLSKKKKLK